MRIKTTVNPMRMPNTFTTFEANRRMRITARKPSRKIVEMTILAVGLSVPIRL
jgi:hypothetical protein